MRNHSGYTGHLYEAELLGEVSGCFDGYMTYNASVAWVKDHQPADWDSTDPGEGLINDLHASVAIGMGLEDFGELELFTAVGSPLDHFHGVDCWFEFKGRVVTIDVTMNKSKVEYKSDFIIHPDDLEEEMEDTARVIANRIIDLAA